MTPPTEPETAASTKFYTLCAIGLLIVVAIATAVSWHQYPMFIDTYYHMAVIEGFSQAGGVTTRAFWEMAPGGRVHIYPPALHVIGYFFYLLGVSPGAFMTVVSGTCYVGCLLTTWIWLRGIIGERSALFSVILLCGPWGFFWNQATFQAVAGVMVVAPLALLALEKERFLACGVLNFIASTMHPMGLFLPPALVLNTLLRRKKILAGLLAASVPVVLYGPWLAHIWANRAFLPESRTGGEITLSGVGGGANLGLLLAPLAALAIVWLIFRRGTALGLVGTLVGFVVVLPMGFGSRFLSFNIHWPLACLAGFAVGEFVRYFDGRDWPLWWAKHFGPAMGWLARWMEQHAPLRAAAHVLAFVVVGTALVAYPALNVPLGRFGRGGPPGPPPIPAASPASSTETETENPGETPSIFANWQVTVQAAALPKLFETYSGTGFGPAVGPMAMGPPMPMGPMPGGGPRRGIGGPMGFGMSPPPGMGFGPGGGPPGGFPGWFPGGGPPMPPGGNTGPGGTPTGPGTAANAAPVPGPQQRRGTGAAMGPGGFGGMGRGPGRAMPGMNVLRNPDAQEFFEAVKANVEPGDVIHIDEGATANLITGATGRWTSSGILRDVRSENARAKPEECDFAVVLGGFMGMPGPGGPRGVQSLPSKFEKVFENDYGTLYRNPAKVEHAREPLAPDVSLPLLAVIALVGVLLIAIDVPPTPRPHARLLAAVAGTIVVGACLLPLASTALDELRHPPSAPAQRWEGPAGFSPGQMLAGFFLREADFDSTGSVSLDEFKALAGRWFDRWDADRSKGLEREEVFTGFQSVFGPPGFGGPMPFPGGPPGARPETSFAQAIFSACDSNNDGKHTREELIAAFARWLREWDEGAKGALDAADLGKGIERLLEPRPEI